MLNSFVESKWDREAASQTRRKFLLEAGPGFGALALAGILDSTATAATDIASRRPHFPAKARSVIFLFMEGGPSHIDLFDP
jgi:hypothetical protein